VELNTDPGHEHAAAVAFPPMGWKSRRLWLLWVLFFGGALLVPSWPRYVLFALAIVVALLDTRRSWQARKRRRQSLA
jgi:hypothetical protein